MNDTPHEHDDLPPGVTPQLPADLPAELVEALRGLDGPAVLPSAAHDDALLAGAREHLAGIAISKVERRGRSRHVLAFIGAGGAVAAAAAVTFAVIVSQGDSEQAASPAVAQSEMDSRRPTDAGRDAAPNAARQPDPEAIVGDLDRSGTIDILDAFALARLIEQGDADPATTTYDVTGDGAVDARDADWLAQRAVAVTRDGGQG